MNDDTNPLPEFFCLLGNAAEAADEYELCDPHDPELFAEQRRTAIALVEFCAANASALKVALARGEIDE